MATQRIVSVILRGDASGLGAELKKVQTQLKATADSVTANTRQAAQFREGMTALGNTAGKVGLVATAGLAAATKASMDWESAWAGVTKTVEGSRSQMSGIHDELREMARTMPATHQEIAAVAQAAGALGVKTPDVVDFTKTMIMLGEATDDLTPDQAATSLAQLMNVMQTAPGDVDNLANALVRLGNNGASTEGQILEMAQALAGAGQTVGLSEADVLGIANALASVGIEAEAGGSAVSRILMDMSKAAKTGSKDLATWQMVAEKGGLATGSFAQTMKESPAEAFDAFTRGLGKINKEGGNVFGLLEDLGQSDIRVTRALLGMANSGDVLKDSLADSADAFANGTDAVDEYQKRSETAAAQMQVAWNGIKDNLIDVGASVLPVVKDMTDIVGDLTGEFSDLPAPLQGAVAKMLGLTAAVGGSVFVATRAITAYSDYRAAMENLGLAAESAGRKQMLLRAGAAAGGIALLSLSSAAGDVDSTLGALTTTAGAAALGFAAAGPWGAAIGAGVGVLGSLGSANRQAAGEIDSLAATLDSQTGAITENTVAWVNNKLRKSGAMDAGLALGLNPATLTDAALGNKKAAQDLKDAMDLVDQTVKSSGDLASPALTEEQEAYETLKKELGDVADAYDKARKQREQDDASKSGSIELNRVSADTADKIAASLDGIPADVITEFTTPGYDNAEQNAVDLARKYNLYPDEVETILRALDYAEPQIQAVLDAMKRTDGKVATVKVNAVTQAANQAIASIRTALGGLTDKTVTVTTKRKSVGGEFHVGGRFDESALQGFAGGGVVPGIPPQNPREDNVMAVSMKGTPLKVRSGEWIINQKSSDANDEWLAAINNGLNMDDFMRSMFGDDVPGFADGGRLDRLEVRRRIRDLQRDLRRTEVVGKGKNKRRRLAVRGLDRDIVQEELKEARAELRDLRKPASQRKEAVAERREKAAEKRREAAEAKREAARELKEARADSAESYRDNADIDFSTSPAAIERNLTRAIADMATFTTLLKELKRRGAAPWLLDQLMKAGPSKGSIRAAKHYLTDAKALREINADAATLTGISNAYGQLTTDPKFTASKAWGGNLTAAQNKTLQQAGNTFNATIPVYPQPGMSETQTAQMVASKLQQAYR